MKLTVFILFLFILSACSEGVKKMDPPADLIPKEKMIDLVGDLTKLESHIQNRYKVITEYHQVMVRSGDSSLSSHGVSRAQFERSMNYYGTHQKEMESIYSEALNELNKELGELDSSK